MARYGKKTKLSSSKVVEKALKFFETDRGFQVGEECGDMVTFTNNIGHITITLCENGETDVEIETREFDYDVKEFLAKI
jgi:hypothetical protein